MPYNYKTSISIRFRDIDAFGHVNNAVFLTYFEIARSAYWREIIHWDWNEVGIIVAKAEIDYLSPVLLTDILSAYVKTSRIGTSSFDIEYALVRETNGEEEICATGKTVCVTYNYLKKSSTPIPQTYKTRMQNFEAIR